MQTVCLIPSFKPVRNRNLKIFSNILKVPLDNMLLRRVHDRSLSTQGTNNELFKKFDQPYCELGNENISWQDWNPLFQDRNLMFRDRYQMYQDRNLMFWDRYQMFQDQNLMFWDRYQSVPRSESNVTGSKSTVLWSVWEYLNVLSEEDDEEKIIVFFDSHYIFDINGPPESCRRLK